MTARTTTTTTTTTTDPCRRYPCDHAYPGRPHVLQAGRVVHSTCCGGSEGEDWDVAIVAVEDEPWRVAVSIAGGPLVAIEPAAAAAGRTAAGNVASRDC